MNIYVKNLKTMEMNQSSKSVNYIYLPFPMQGKYTEII